MSVGSTGYLLDTVVLSELRKTARDPHVEAWIAQQDGARLFISVVTLGEIERDIAKVEARDPDFAAKLSAWAATTTTLYATHVLPVDTRIARRWGRLTHDLGRSDADVLIAATALEHDLTVVTRNVRHFEPTGVAVHDPFDGP